MATFDITVGAQSAQTHPVTRSDNFTTPGDFDGATIDSVVVVGSPTITSDGVTDDSFFMRWEIQTSIAVAIFGNNDADTTSVCFAVLGDLDSSDVITDGSARSPNPTIAVAADWDRVGATSTYSPNMMADNEAMSWDAFTIRVTYTPLAPDVRQTHYRFAAPITGAAHEAYTLVGLEDVAFSYVLDTDYCLIVKLGNAGGANAAAQDWQLEYKVDSGSFTDVNATSSNVRTVASGDTDNATSTTERLAGSARTFDVSKIDDVNGSLNLALTLDNDYELYYAITFRDADLVGTETITFRIIGAIDTVTYDITPTAQTPDIRQEHYRFCTPITGAAHEAYTLVGSEDTSFEIVLDDDYCLIIKWGNDGNTASVDARLQYNVDGAGWNAVNGSSSNVRTVDSGDTDGATSGTERLTTSARTFAFTSLDEVDGELTFSGVTFSDIENYYAITFRSADLSGGETITFRMNDPTNFIINQDITPNATVPSPPFPFKSPRLGKIGARYY